MSDAFSLLSRSIQKWVHSQGWNSLRNVQTLSIPIIIDQSSDLIISAPTAAGKTEAAFLPALSIIEDQNEGVGVLYISPLKALINDQARRLEDICRFTKIKTHPWHGDVPQGRKNNVVRRPSGVMLITPESLESLLMNKRGWVQNAFKGLRCIIIDEYHAFISTERGAQLHSLLNRIEHLIGQKVIPRIALSATMGDLDFAMNNLRNREEYSCEIVNADTHGKTLLFNLKGFRTSKEEQEKTRADFITDLFETLRGKTNLIFANSRRLTEHISTNLKDMCEDSHVPNEFFPHHGSLSKVIREQLEARLLAGKLPTSAVCTMTLELGIDIGKVDSVVQIDPPQSISSIRQRLGRCGRRGGPARLWMYNIEPEINDKTHIINVIRMGIVQSVAMMKLMLIDNWYEPYPEKYHYSTLLHQIVSIIAQWGSVSVPDLWGLISSNPTFKNISVDDLKILLNGMGEKQLIQQLNSGELVIGKYGEKLVSHYSFYSVFQTNEEYRVIFDNAEIGTLPIDNVLFVGREIVLAGNRWSITGVDNNRLVINVVRSKDGRVPKFSGKGLGVAKKIRKEMYHIYCSEKFGFNSNNEKPILDQCATDLIKEGFSQFKILRLDKRNIIQYGYSVIIFTWDSDEVANTLMLLLKLNNIKAHICAGTIEIRKSSVEIITQVLKRLLQSDQVKESDLCSMVDGKELEKYDYLVPESLLNKEYALRRFDIPGAYSWIKSNI